MYYLGLLYGREDGPAWVPGTPEFGSELERFAAFDEMAGDAVVGGAALYPSDEAISIRKSSSGPTISDGPYVEMAEVIGGFYVFECADLDEVVDLARQNPAASDGVVELWPMVEWQVEQGRQADWWLALLLEPPASALTPGTKEWDEGGAEHFAFAARFGGVIRGGGALYPPSAATTVCVRDGQVLLTDGPFAESAEVANGLYLFSAPGRVAATTIAAQIPVGDKGGVEVRQIVDLGE